MVYLGKPSRGCQMCRTRRIKCDETKPTCNQCAKSRRQCPGYRDDFDIVFRNETQATERRARKALNGNRTNAHIKMPNQPTISSVHRTYRSGSLISSKSDVGMMEWITPNRSLSVSIEQQAPCFFLSTYVLSPTVDTDTPRGYFDFIAPLLMGEGPDSHLTLAFTATAMASLAKRPNSRARMDLKQMAIAQYTKALKATNLALQNPTMQKTDQTLAAVLLLGFYETICTENNNAAAWYSHIDGAVQIVRMRGQKQRRTKIGESLFNVVRSQMVINCLTSAKLPNGGCAWWTASDIKEEIGATITSLQIRIAELRYEMNQTLSNYSRDNEQLSKVMDLMRRAQVIEDDYQAWEAALPDFWNPKTVAWVDNIAGMDLANSEVCPGKVETYHNLWIGTFWNFARVARLSASGVMVRCAAWMCSPVDYRTTPEYAHATRLCVDLCMDVISSIPYHLGWNIWKGSSLTAADMSSFEAGLEAFSNPRGIGGYFALWPLFVLSTSDYCTDSQRTWIKGRMLHIADILGMNHARVLANFQIRLPSMTIYRDHIGRYMPSQLTAPRNYVPPSPNPSTSFTRPDPKDVLSKGFPNNNSKATVPVYPTPASFPQIHGIPNNNLQTIKNLQTHSTSTPTSYHQPTPLPTQGNSYPPNSASYPPNSASTSPNLNPQQQTYQQSPQHTPTFPVGSNDHATPSIPHPNHTESPPPKQYTLSPSQQRELVQKETFEREREILVRKAAGDQGEVVERLMAKYLHV